MLRVNPAIDPAPIDLKSKKCRYFFTFVTFLGVIVIIIYSWEKGVTNDTSEQKYWTWEKYTEGYESSLHKLNDVLKQKIVYIVQSLSFFLLAIWFLTLYLIA